MRFRRTGLATAGAALGLVALVAVVAAQAAPQQKTFSATVRVVDGDVSATHATLRLILTNKTRSQTLGSANFTAPEGITVGAVVRNADRPGWTASRLSDRVVAFRSTSNALPNGQSVSADVSVTISQSTCGSATWMAQGKQSNDFSGTGNDFQFDPQGSDLTPLGRFDVAPPIETEKGGQVIPALETNTSFEWTATAYDLCGDLKPTYTGASLTRTFLTGADFDPTGGQTLAWDQGVGTVTFTPTLTETGNRLTVTDTLTGVTESSNFFDVSDTLCVPGPDPCVWQKDKIKADAAAPTGNANLGIGFNELLNFECNNTSEPLGGAVVNINPRGYEEPFTVSITYSKPFPNGPASQFVVCFTDEDDGTGWSEMPACPASPPCVLEQKKTTGGELLFVLQLTQDDPWTGVG